MQELELDDIQGLVLTHRPSPYWGTFTYLRFDTAAGGRAFISVVLPEVSSTAHVRESDRDGWVGLCFTYSGLAALGLPDSVLTTFPENFRVEMAKRAQFMGQVGASDPSKWDAPYGSGQLHACVVLVCSEEQQWHDRSASLKAAIGRVDGVTVLGSLDHAQAPDGKAPFGYADGISLTPIEGSGIDPVPGAGTPIKAGEMILGYDGEAGYPLPAPSPDVLGRNGTFLAVLKFQTKDAEFRQFLRANATDPQDEELLAAKLCGRWRSGAPLALSPDADDPSLASDPQRRNSFDYSDDPMGFNVPLGAHIRRVNPRASDVKTLVDVRQHRVIRHGFTYGEPLAPDVLEDDGADRGMYFIFASAKAPSTLEFLMTQWLNDGNFAGLSDEQDPIAGSNDGTGHFTIPRKPIRRRLQGLTRFTILRGGEYMFAPSLTALKWLSEGHSHESPAH